MSNPTAYKMHSLESHRCGKMNTAISPLYIFHLKGNPLVQPNFQFEKRQKELARKKKQEEKKQRKLEEKTPLSPTAPEHPAKDKAP